MELNSHSVEQFVADLQALGLQAGDTVMMHSSFKSLGGIEGGAAGVFEGLERVLGENGTLILPAFSYSSVNYENSLFDREATPSCVGYLPEYFRTQVPGVIRSMHATHSCSLKGKLAEELAEGHELDLTPVGANSPMAKLPKVGGKILILGSHPDRNTALHGIEEMVKVPYVLDYDRPIAYVLRDGERVIEQSALRHYFKREHCTYLQCYGRILSLLSKEECLKGKVLDAQCYLMSAKAVWEKGCAKLQEDPYYFVDRVDHDNSQR